MSNTEIYIIHVSISHKLGVWESTADGRSWICYVTDELEDAKEYVRKHRGTKVFDDSENIKWNDNAYSIEGPIPLKQPVGYTNTIFDCNID